MEESSDAMEAAEATLDIENLVRLKLHRASGRLAC
jgi:hypothetical protein